MGWDEVALENRIRKMLYNHIVEYPGVSFPTLERIYNLNHSTLRYHLKYLESAERITSKLEVGKLHYYVNNGNENFSNPINNKLDIQNLTPPQEQILLAIKQHPGINQTELIAKTSFQRHILTYNISKLIELGFVKKSNYDKNVCYEYISKELLNYELLKILAIKLMNKEIDEQTYLKLRSKLKKD
jgi:predicted transcriptional regulator